MKKLSILSAITLIPLFLISQTNIPGGSVSGTWTKANSPYLIEGDIVLNGNDSLILNPGVEVVFLDSYWFKIVGYVEAIGEENDSIHITVADTTGFHNNTNMSHTILIEYLDYTLEFMYCKIDFGNIAAEGGFSFKNSTFKYGRLIELIGGASYANYLFSDFVISNNNGNAMVSSPFHKDIHCSNGIISNNSGGIELDMDNDLTMSNCIVENNSFGINGQGNFQLDSLLIKGNKSGGIYWSGISSNLIINNSIIENNGTIGCEGGGLNIYECDGGTIEINNTTIRNNHAENGGGICFIYSSPCNITNTIISNNTAVSGGGIYVWGGSHNFDNVLIIGNHAVNSGGGIYSQELGLNSTVYSNTNIINNTSDSIGGGIYYTETYLTDSVMLINSSIVHGNFPEEIFVDSIVNIGVLYSIIKGGWPGTGNIDEDPLFIDPSNGNYHLSWINYPNDDYTKSPCINTGDPALPLDPDGSITDMGAYPFDQSAQQQVTIDIKAFFEGCYFVDQMTPFLNSLGHIPFDQPYGIEPWNHFGAENVASIPNNDVIDWVFVEMRKLLDYSTYENYTTESRQTAFILSDGSVVGTDGSSSIEFYTAEDDSLHICLFHRNHIPLISANAILITDNPISYDFTISEQMAIGGKYSQNEVSPGIWGMIAADGNSDGKVNNNDKNDVWLFEEGNTGYFTGDFNMDSEVDVDDKIVMWEPNAGKGSPVPD